MWVSNSDKAIWESLCKRVLKCQHSITLTPVLCWVVPQHLLGDFSLGGPLAINALSLTFAQITFSHICHLTLNGTCPSLNLFHKFLEWNISPSFTLLCLFQGVGGELRQPINVERLLEAHVHWETSLMVSRWVLPFAPCDSLYLFTRWQLKLNPWAPPVDSSRKASCGWNCLKCCYWQRASAWHISFSHEGRGGGVLPCMKVGDALKTTVCDWGLPVEILSLLSVYDKNVVTQTFWSEVCNRVWKMA